MKIIIFLITTFKLKNGITFQIKSFNSKYNNIFQFKKLLIERNFFGDKNYDKNVRKLFWISYTLLELICD